MIRLVKILYTMNVKQNGVHVHCAMFSLRSDLIQFTVHRSFEHSKRQCVLLEIY